jgi:hypothetical protein
MVKNKLLLIPVFFILAISTGAAPAGPLWREFKTNFFSISFPAAPAQRGSAQWVAADSKGRAFSVNLTDLSDAPANPEDYFRQTVDQLSRGLHYDVIYQKNFKGQDLPACEFKITNAQHVVVGRLFLRKDRLYMLQVATDTDRFEEKLLRKFFDSFKIHQPGAVPKRNPRPAPSPAPEDPGPAVQPW